MQAQPRVAVVGAGPAGLAVALALRREAGLDDVTVYERAPELRPNIGGGVQLHAGASLLEGLGVNLEEWANPLRRIHSRAADGSTLLRVNIPALVEQFRPFTGSLLRKSGDLVSCTVMRDALLEAMAAALPEGSIRCGQPLKAVRLSDDGDGVECQFGGDPSAHFDLVVAADGIGSLARGCVEDSAGGSGSGEAPTASEPRYTGLRIRYGVREAGGRPAGAEDEAHQWFGKGVYALTATYGGRGGKKYEMIAVVFRDDQTASENLDWQPSAIREDCVQQLRDAGLGSEVLKVAEGCDRFFELGVCERPLGIERWHRGRLVLVGDSAHAMPPFLGQGANQAVQDAVCLARWLRQADFASGASGPAVEAALCGYTAQRLPPVAVLGLESSFLGQVETLPGDVGSFVRDNFFRLTGKTGIAGLVFLNGALERA